MVSSDGIGDGTCLFGFGSHLSQSLVISEAKGNHQKCRSIEFFPQTQALPEPNVRHASPPFRQDDAAHSMKISQPHCSHSFLDLPCFASTHIDQMGIFRKKTMTNWDMMWYNSQANNSQYSSTCKKAGNPPKSSNIYGWPSLWRARARTIIWVLHGCGHDKSWHNINSYCSTNTSRISKTHTRTRTFFAHQSETGATAGLCGLLLHNHENQTSNISNYTNHFVSSGYALVLIPKWIVFDPPNHDLFLLVCRSKMVQTESPTKFSTSRGPHSAPRHFSISNLDCSNCSWWTIPSWWIFFWAKINRSKIFNLWGLFFFNGEGISRTPNCPKPIQTHHGPIASGHPVALGSASTVHSLPAAPHRPKRIEMEGQQAGAVSTFQALVSRKRCHNIQYDNEWLNDS